MNKYVSHGSAVFVTVEPIVIASPVCNEYLSLVDDTFDGKVVKRSDFVVDDPRTRHSGLTCSDFSIENQVAAGVNLKPAVVSLSQLNMVDRLSYETNLLADFIKNHSKN